MAEAVNNFNLNLSSWETAREIPSVIWNHPFSTRIRDNARPAVIAAGRNAWDNRLELTAGAAFGFGARYIATAGLQSLGMEGVPEILIRGVIVGVASGLFREYILTRDPLARHPLLETIARGALFGFIGAGVGAWFSDRLHDFARPDLHRSDISAPATSPQGPDFTQLRNQAGDKISTLLGHPTMPWDGGWHFPGIKPPEAATTPVATVATPRPIATAIPQPTAETIPNSTIVPKPGIPSPVPLSVPEPGLPTEAIIANNVDILKNNLQIDQALAPRVGFHLAAVSESSPFYSQAQHILEVQAHDSKLHALRQVMIDHPNFDVNNAADLKLAADKAQATFDQDYAKNNLENVVQGWAHSTSASVVAVEVPASTHEVAQSVNNFVEVNRVNHELFIDHLVQHGETASHMVQEMGIAPTYDGHDLYGFVALSASNPDQFRDIANGLGLSTEDLLKLLYQADQGDINAARQVYKALSLIKAGVHIKLPTREAITKMAELLKNTRIIAATG